MKFSLSLIKKLVPGIKDKKELIRKLNLHFFETEDFSPPDKGGGKRDILDISIPANRFSDAASHFGIAQEISAIYGRDLRTQNIKLKIKNLNNAKAPFKVLIKDKNLCPRYGAQYFENIKVAESPKWIKDVLIDCGLRPINNVVDITNYVMLETGQPLHAFDYDKLLGIQNQKLIIIRRAKNGEKIITLDNKIYELNENTLVIADNKEPLAIAGIKGGKKAEVDKNTKRIIVEAANFEGTNIYKTSKALKLSTDASLRFSHNLNPELVLLGINRMAQLLNEIVGAKPGQIIDVNSTKPNKKIIKFDIEKFNKFIGVDLDFITVSKYLTRLGFKIIQDSRSKIQDSFLVEVPVLRQDIEAFDDLAEEVVRLYGYNKLKSVPPRIYLHPSGFEDQIILKDKIRKILTGMGLNEVYNYSFISKDDEKKLIFGGEIIELENPISKDFYYLRPSLAAGFLKNAENNFKFLDEVRIFEIGKTFAKENSNKITERLTLGVVVASKNKETFFELKGIVGELFKKSGLVDYLIADPETKENDWVKDFTKEYLDNETALKIESENIVFGYLGQFKNSLSKWKINVFEIDLDVLLKLVVEEHEYRPLPKYPSIMRDISILVDRSVRVGEIMQAIQETDLKRSPEQSRRIINDVDLIDEYDINKSVLRGLTFRIVFQAEDRTLTDEEVNKEIQKIYHLLESKFKAKIR